MKKLIIAGLIPLVASSTIYQAPSPLYSVEGEVYEVSTMPKVRNQQQIGLCYAFSATTLLDSLVCREERQNCVDKDSDELLSILHVASNYNYSTPEIDEGGQSAKILSNIKSKGRRIFKSEACYPYRSLEMKKTRIKENGKKETTIDAGHGWDQLHDSYDIYQKSPHGDVAVEQANVLKDVMPLKSNVDKIIDAFSAYSFENFAYRATSPESCIDSSNISLPSFEIKTFPSHIARKNDPKNVINYENMLATIENVILNDFPLTMNLCTNIHYKKGDKDGLCKGHALVISGLKEVCKMNKRDCITLLKVHNSYGQGWQDSHNGGWLDARELIKASVKINAHNRLVWLTPEYYRLEYRKMRRLSQESLKPKVEIVTNDIDWSKSPIVRCGSSFIGSYFDYQKVADKSKCKVVGKH